MADVTPFFETCLQKHGKVRIRTRDYDVHKLDEFLKEAYSIVSCLKGGIQWSWFSDSIRTLDWLNYNTIYAQFDSPISRSHILQKGSI